MAKHWGEYVTEGRYRRCIICGRVTGWFSKATPLIHKGRKP